MPVATAGGTRLVRVLERFDPRGVPLSVGRTLLAASSLMLLLFNTDADLFVATLEHPSGMSCDGIRAGTPWCLAGDAPVVARAVTAAVLLITASGYRPRWTCVPHWYVTAGLAMSMPMANGGDKIAQIVTLLLVPICLGDDRTWQWSRPAHPPTPGWRGAGLAALWVLRAQVSLIYLYAALSKLADPLWRQGSGLSVVFADPLFGLAQEVHEAAEPVLRSYWPMALLNWSVIAVQVVIAVAVVSGPRARAAALVLGLVLHLCIAGLMNLPLFSLVVIATLIIGCAPFGSRGVRRTRLWWKW